MENIIKKKGFRPIDKPVEGGFAIVYKAQNDDGVIRAFKTPKIPSEANAEVRKKINEDFKNECEKLMSLGNGDNPSPNIIKTFDYEISQEPYYLEMDYIDGMPFDGYAENHFMKIEEVFHFIENIAGALAYCHQFKDKNGNERCIIHNDLHSANIRYNKKKGNFILLDFGLSMEKGERIRTSNRSKGWCEFMPPERCHMECYPNSSYKNDPATPAWDIYSLGCLIYLALTGQAPFPYPIFTNNQICHMHIGVERYKPWEKIANLRNDHFYNIYPYDNYKNDCPTWLVDMIKKCMARNTKDRYQNAQEFIEDFTRNKRTKQQTVSYDDYIKVSKLSEHYERENKKLKEEYKTLERKSSKMNSYINKTERRNWFIALIVEIALSCNCMSYLGHSEQDNTTLKIVTVVITILYTIVIIGIYIYDRKMLESHNK